MRTGIVCARGEVRAGRGLRPALACVPARALSLREIIAFGFPRADLDREVAAWRRRNLRHLWRGLKRVLAARALDIPHLYGQLSLAVITSDGVRREYGLASLRVITNAGVAFLVDAFQNLVELEVMKYHGIGTGTVAESASDTALQSELSTQYSPDNTRATGSTTEGSAANIYRTVGTNTVDASVAITEHGIFSQAASGGGVLWDRSVFAVINLASGDSLQTTYDATFNAGG